MNTITGRSAFLALLKDEGITHLFGNPGTTELPIMHALKDFPDLTYVLGLQESLVVAMADGFSRASGQLVACNVHVAPGLGNAMGSLFNAKFTGTPMILTAGQQELGHGLTEPLLYDPLVPIAEPLVKWAVEVPRLDDLPRILRRAAKVAMTPPMGPVFISLPGDILNNEAGLELGASTRVDARVRPADDLINTLADRLIAAKKPLIVCGDEIVKSDALAEAAEFASALGAPAYQQSVGFGSHFLSEHPNFMGGISREQKEVRDLLLQHDLMVVLGGDPLRMSVWSDVEPRPPELAIVHIGLNDWDMGKNYDAEIAVRADVGETLRALTPALKAKGGQALAIRAEETQAELTANNWSANRDKQRARVTEAGSGAPLNPDFVSLQIADALPKDAIVVNESLTSGRLLTQFVPYRERYDYHALASGGIGWSLPASVGVSLAQEGRPVLCYTGDGSAMYSIQALWTAARMKLPITYVIANNGGYRIIKQRLLSFHGNDHFIGMDFADPAIDFAQLAQSMGMPSERITEPGQLKPALEAAFANRGGPNLLDVSIEGTVG